MAIVTSTFSLEQAQNDGRRWCTELHTDNAGLVHKIEYLSAVGDDHLSIALARATMIDVQIKARELHAAVFDAPWDYVLKYATLAELSAWVRAEYKEANRERLIFIEKRILDWIANGRFTDVQIRTAFGLSASAWTTLKNKMQTAVNNYAAINQMVGE